MKVNLSGDRLGSGARMNVELHNYYRSTHNLSKKFQSSLAPGILYPAYTNIALNGDKWEIDIESITRTLPTQGPLFGSYKMQVDCFLTPIRLYQGVLHNNPINIGLKMADVKLPKINLKSLNYDVELQKWNDTYQIHPSNIWKYFGLSGLGILETQQQSVQREINALPLLTYYDIFKNYYANKQEDNAFVITQDYGRIEFLQIFKRVNEGDWYQINKTDPNSFEFQINNADISITMYGHNLEEQNQRLIPVVLDMTRNGNTTTQTFTLYDLLSLTHENAKPWRIKFKWHEFQRDENGQEREMLTFVITRTDPNIDIVAHVNANNSNIQLGINMTAFPLENIDKMREEILKSTELGATFHVENTNLFPYTLNTIKSNINDLRSPLLGMCVKTYQADMFNNWLKTETITGENGIAEITKVDTSNGLELDALNLAQKVYNMLNRIAATGGTYEDWQEAVYTQSAIRKAESPIYMGGMSAEVMFEEVIATTQTETINDKSQALGSLGGRGKQFNKKGGHIEFKVEEPSIVMVIVSLTPRITQSQGNKWYLTEINSIDDLHKPALDGIGYQDLLVERMAWTGTKLNNNGTIIERLSAGKTVAWLDYMTDVNECYGDFAYNGKLEGTAYMVLNRNYNIFDGEKFVAPTDITTYIDPKKFNYAFAVNSLEAQNFWTEIQFKIKCRRLMSAKQIPNL